MIKEPLLTVCIPAVMTRWDRARMLLGSLHGKSRPEVEVLVLADNYAMTVGEKRTALLRAARGRFVSFVDDDDGVEETYLDHILSEIRRDPYTDLVTFQTRCTLRYRDGREVVGIVEQHFTHPEEEFDPSRITRRRPTQIAAWRTELVRDVPFPAIQWGEDRAWGDAAMERLIAGSWSHVPEVLYHYNWSESASEARA